MNIKNSSECNKCHQGPVMHSHRIRWAMPSKTANQLQTQHRSHSRVMGMCACWSGQAQCHQHVYQNIHLPHNFAQPFSPFSAAAFLFAWLLHVLSFYFFICRFTRHFFFIRSLGANKQSRHSFLAMNTRAFVDP